MQRSESGARANALANDDARNSQFKDTQFINSPITVIPKYEFLSNSQLNAKPHDPAGSNLVLKEASLRTNQTPAPSSTSTARAAAPTVGVASEQLVHDFDGLAGVQPTDVFSKKNYFDSTYTTSTEYFRAPPS